MEILLNSSTHPSLRTSEFFVNPCVLSRLFTHLQNISAGVGEATIKVTVSLKNKLYMGKCIFG